jgi:ABC-2 type transport system ATP-binding protein
MNTDIILHTQHLSKRFKTRWAVDDVNLEIHRGDVFGFLGPNGAGKSTTIRMLLSLIQPTRGEIELFGESLRKKRYAALKKVCGIVEKPDFYLYLSAYKNLQLLGALAGGTTKKKILEILELVGLAERAHDKVKTYSHGMKQRLGIAQALLSEPELVILDEPTNGLDPQGMKEVRDLIHLLSREKQMTIFLSSHLLHEVEQVATRMAIINRGKLVVQGRVDELLNIGDFIVLLRAQPHSETIALLKSDAANGWISAVTEKPNGIEVKIAPTDVPRLNKFLVINNIAVSALIPKRSLEEFFLSITEGTSEVN